MTILYDIDFEDYIHEGRLITDMAKFLFNITEPINIIPVNGDGEECKLIHISVKKYFTPNMYNKATLANGFTTYEGGVYDKNGLLLYSDSLIWVGVPK